MLLSNNIKLCDFRPMCLLCADSCERLILIIAAKAHCWIIRSHYGGHSHTLVTHGFAESFILLAALISQRAHPDLCVSAIGKHKVQ